MFKKMRIFIVLVLLFSLSLENSLSTLASSDITPPTIKSIDLDKIQVQPGDNINFTVEAEDIESGISSSPVIQLKRNTTAYTEGIYIYLTFNATTNKYEGNFNVPSDAINGEWYISWIHIKDNVGNVFYDFPFTGSAFYRSFTVINGSNDTTPPTIKSIELDKTTAQPGEIIKFAVEAEDLQSGIVGTPVIQLKRNTTTYTEGIYVYLTYNATTNNYEGALNVPSDAINGEWYISWIHIKDDKGNVFYDFPSTGSTFYRNFTIINGSNDTTPPVIKSIELDQSAVQLGGNINFTIEAEDLESGIAGTPVIQLKRNTTSYTEGIYVYLTYNLTTNKYEGTFNVPSNAIEGEWYISWLNIKDNVGNVFYDFPSTGSTFYRSFRISKDIIPPDIPSASEVTDQSTFLTGTAEVGSLITVMKGTSVIGSNSTFDDGTFSVTIPKQNAGTKLTVTATDDAGNLSEGKLLTVKDVTAPDITSVNEVTDKSTSVTGKAEAGSMIQVEMSGSLIGSGETGMDGTFIIDVPVQKAEVELDIIATDKAGNVSESTRVLVRDVTAPEKPEVNEVTDNDNLVTGLSEAGSKVEVKVNGSVIGSGAAGEDGQYKVTIDVQKEGTKLEIVATDKAGNVSETTKVVVEDVIAPSKPVVIEVTDKDNTVIGQAEAGSKVEVKVNGSEIGSGTAGEDDQFKVTISAQKAGIELAIIATDKAGNVSETTTVVVKDVTAPVKPEVNEVTDKDTALTGQAEAGSKVEVRVNGSVIGTGTAGEDGQFTVTISAQKAGAELVIVATDKAGNVSETTTVVVRDVTAPEKPVVNAVTDKDTTVIGQAEAGSKVEVKVNDSVIGSGTAGEDGQYIVTIDVQKAGTELVIVTTDMAGNGSETTTVVVKDVTAPVKPEVNEVIDKDTIVTGQAEAGSTVEVKVNGSVIGTGTAGKDGQFTLIISAQKAGTELVIVAKDKAGNVSETTTVVVKDVTAPVKPEVNEVTDKDTTVTGQAEAGSKVEVRVNGSVIGTGTAGEDGQFTVTISAQKAGAELVIVATDKAGNVSETTTVVVKDVTAPVKPEVNQVSDKDTIVSGQAEVGSTIEVKVNGSVIATDTVGQDGKYKVTIRVQKAGTLSEIIATDTAGNQSEGTTIKVIDKTAPSIFTVNLVSDKSKEVTGKAEAGATVSVLIGIKIYAAKVDTNGYFKVIIPAQKAGTKLIVTAKDAAGNVSAAKSITVLDKTAPVTPTVSTISDQAKVVTGKAEVGAIVTVTIGSKKYIAKADAKGNFRVTIPVQKAGTKVIVTAKDAAGNVSVSKSVIVIDKTAPTAPKIKTTVKSTTKEVTGTAEAYSTITIKVGSKVIGTAQADSKGKFKVKIKAQKKNTVLSVIATDKAKNVSKAATVKVK